MAEAVGDNKIMGLHESSQQFGEGSKDMRGDEAASEMGDVDIARIERVYRYFSPHSLSQEKDVDKTGKSIVASSQVLPNFRPFISYHYPHYINVV